MTLGADEQDYAFRDSTEIALDFIRLRATELCTWLGTPGMQPALRDQSRDVTVRMLPTPFLRRQPSCGAAILLSLLKLHLGCRIKDKVATTGIITLTGYVMKIGGVIVKVRAALKHGAEIVIVPGANYQEAKEHLTADELSKVRSAVHVVQLLEHAIEGK